MQKPNTPIKLISNIDSKKAFVCNRTYTESVKCRVKKIY